jgi:hypothetical protein
VLILIRVIVVLHIVESIAVLMDKWLQHLVRDFVLLVLGSRLKTCRSNRVDLSQSLVCSLGIFSKSMVIFVGIVVVLDIIESIPILVDEWLEHLVWHFILLILGCWLQTSWCNWVDLSVVANMVQVLERVVMVDVVVLVHHVFPVEWLLQLVRNLILVIRGWWLKSSWSTWIDLHKG